MKKKYVVVLLLMGIVLGGCVHKTNTTSSSSSNKATSSAKIEENNIENLIKSFENIGSREIGSKNNKTAGKFIADYWKQSGIDAYDGTTYYYKFKSEGDLEIEVSDGKFFSFSGDAENIAGKIKGKDSTKAIVLSAHFDTWPGVKGILDNASGTASVMYLSNKLKEFYGFEKPPVDIVFVAFNGEEYMLQGSKAFCDTLAKDYQNFYNINLDCVGQKGLGLIYDSENKLSQQLVVALKPYLEAQKLKLLTEKLDDESSDHGSFLEKGKAAITLGDNVSHRYIHTEKDNKINLDYDEMNRIITALQNFIVEDDGKMY
ncbi:M28 family metallopeptidase [Lactococcus lactis]|uniref:M28 family metallopeptidase n=1 Tax=Lactococcus lactis TaxID=1358 RepID=UPI001D194835|nr:M28 family metallopeptidase [Lactococcus lactis]MCC4121539.1 M28 family metallopeptidase [Lactococcus lactis]